MIFTQGDLDTRVPPLQGRKMTARVQAASSSGLPVILRYRPRAGHAGGRSRVQDRAMDTAFLMMQLGMSYWEEGRHDIRTDEDWPSAAAGSEIACTARPTDG